MAGVFIDPRESAKYISDRANHVRVNLNAVKSLSKEILDSFQEENGFSLDNWRQHELHPDVADDAAIEWIFLIDSLNFSFWSESAETKYSVNGFTGYWALCAAVNRCMQRGRRDDGSRLDVTDARTYATITLAEMERMFESDLPGMRIPLLEERMDILHENGSILLQKFDGKFKNCLVESRHSAASLLRLVVESFPSFRDQITFRGRPVSFYKRAQILVADIWACFQGRGDGLFNDIDVLTMFPDYRVPQVLAYKGVLSYSPQLLTFLKSGQELAFGDEMEVEIRGLSVHAVDLILHEISSMIVSSEGSSTSETGIPGTRLMKDCSHLTNCKEGMYTGRIKSINSVLIDFYLWDLRRQKCLEIDSTGIPFHKTRCVFY